jgi:hypothetical protein
VAARLFGRDPFALAIGIGHESIGALRYLERDERPVRGHPSKEARVQRGGFFFQHAACDGDSGCFQTRKSISGNARVGIDDRAHDAGDPR